MWSSILDPDIRGASVLWDSADNQTLWDCAESWNEVDFDFRTRIQNDTKAWIWSTLWILGNLLFYFISTIIIDQFVFLFVGFLGQANGETLFPSFPDCVAGQVRQHRTGLAVERFLFLPTTGNLETHREGHGFTNKETSFRMRSLDIMRILASAFAERVWCACRPHRISSTCLKDQFDKASVSTEEAMAHLHWAVPGNIWKVPRI